MSVDTKLMFGLRASNPVTLTVTGKPGSPAPDLRIRSHGQAEVVTITYGDGAWIATLVAGDHVVWMEAPGESWFDGPVAFTLSAEALIVRRSVSTSSPVIGYPTTGAAEDPKNPPPPPLDAGPLANQTWFAEQLQVLNSNATVARSMPECLVLPRHGQ